MEDFLEEVIDVCWALQSDGFVWRRDEGRRQRGVVRPQRTAMSSEDRATGWAEGESEIAVCWGPRGGQAPGLSGGPRCEWHLWVQLSVGGACLAGRLELGQDRQP